MPDRIKQVELSLRQKMTKAWAPIVVGLSLWGLSDEVRKSFWFGRGLISSDFLKEHFLASKFFADSGADVGAAVAATGVFLLFASLRSKSLNKKTSTAMDVLISFSVPLIFMLDEIFLHQMSKTLDQNDFTGLLGTMILMPAVTLLFNLVCTKGINLKSLKKGLLGGVKR